MIICIPVTEDKGKQSPVSAHFGSAPIYLLVDTDTMACQAVPNTNQHLAHGGPLGGCKPVDSLDGLEIDAVAARGIGAGAQSRLQAAGIEVLKTPHKTVAETVREFLAGGLKPAEPKKGCAHRRQGSVSQGQHYGRFVKVPGAHHGCGGHSHGDGCHEDHDDD